METPEVFEKVRKILDKVIKNGAFTQDDIFELARLYEQGRIDVQDELKGSLGVHDSFVEKK